KALVLCLLKYDKEVRKLAEFDLPVKELKAYKINKKEIDVAKQLIKSMSSKWKPEKYVDEYQKAVHKWVEESANKLPHTTMKQRPHAKASNAVNFVDLLKKSLASSGKTTNGKKSVSKAKKVIKPKAKPARHATKH